jgi:chemotaxis protein MotA
MAVALLTTFYGAIMGTVVLAPLAAKVERNANEDMLLKNLIITGATSMARQENPRRLEILLNSLLPERLRIHYFN